jgi:aspartyl aminopeptidase
MTEKKTGGDLDALHKKIIRKPVLVWDRFTAAEKKKAFDFAEPYKRFLDEAKTERLAVAAIVRELESRGFVDMEKADRRHRKIYGLYRNKAVAAAVIGTRPVSDGLHLIGAHVDSPRLDLKQNPLYEEVDLAMLKVHYYGGIRKYQWLARPLALYGTVIRRDGSAVDIALGDEPGDPVFTIADLLPHLARKSQESKKLADVFEGEKLNLVAGSLPLGGAKARDRFKLTVMNYLHDRYQMVEEDLVSAEIEAVPAGTARDIGFDRSLIGAYGQDDRVCAFTLMKALSALKHPRRTAVALFFDKEEIGSEGSTGAKSVIMEDFVSDLALLAGEPADARSLRKTLARTSALSADVNGALDPDFQEVHEKRNAARLGYGVCITKFTGSGGKSGANDASAEFVGRVRGLFNRSGIVWQTGELGRVDEGGGGTIAKYLAEYGMDIVDCGPALLSMHSPFEISSKGDVYVTARAYQAFFESED